MGQAGAAGGAAGGATGGAARGATGGAALLPGCPWGIHQIWQNHSTASEVAAWAKPTCEQSPGWSSQHGLRTRLRWSGQEGQGRRSVPTGS